MAGTNWIVLAVQGFVKYFFAPNSLIFHKSLDERRQQVARQLQDVMLYKQTQKKILEEIANNAPIVIILSKEKKERSLLTLR